MYICLECGYRFQYSEKLTEKHGFKNGPFESLYVCPACKSENYQKEKSDYCQYCGSKLKKGQLGYCSQECKDKGKKAWLKEKKRKKLLFDSPLYKRVREAEQYNRLHKTKYSYGQYTAIIKKGK